MKSPKSLANLKQFREDKSKKPSKTGKICPKDAPELKSAIEAARLDGRTRHAQHLKETRRLLSENPVEIALNLQKDILSLNIVILQAIVREVTAQDFKVFNNGVLNPVLAKHFSSVQQDIAAASGMVLKLQTALDVPKANSAPNTEAEPVDVSAIVLELSNKTTS